MIEHWIIFVFVVLLLLPFIPSLLEIYLKKDIDPLYIKQDYSKDPAYFGRSFQKLLTEALKKELKKSSNNVIEINLHKENKEKLIIIDNDKIGGEFLDLILVNKLNVETNQVTRAIKEVVIKGNFNIKHPSDFKNLLIFGNLNIDELLKVKRWIHVEGEVNIRAFAILGINLYAEKINILAPCLFKRMFASIIKVGNEIEEEFKDNISFIKGTIKSKGPLNITVENKRLIIEGNVISDKDIILNGNIWVKGNIFSNLKVILLNNVIIGEEGKIKSVVGKKGVILKKGVKIYGYVHTDGEGKVEI